MRVVSWMVVFVSISALAWKGLSPLSGGFSLPEIPPGQAVGAVASEPDHGAMPVTMAAADDNMVAVFKGSESRHTPEFEVTAPWLLDWHVTQRDGYDAAVDVSLEAAGTGVHQGSVLKTKHPGNGVRLFNEGGRFYFRVNSSMANWTLKVQQLTPEEAAAYTPRNASD